MASEIRVVTAMSMDQEFVDISTSTTAGNESPGRTRAEFRAWCGSNPQELRQQVLADAAWGLTRARGSATQG